MGYRESHKTTVGLEYEGENKSKARMRAVCGPWWCVFTVIIWAVIACRLSIASDAGKDKNNNGGIRRPLDHTLLNIGDDPSIPFHGIQKIGGRRFSPNSPSET